MSSSRSTVVLSLTMVYSCDRRAKGTVLLLATLGKWLLSSKVAAKVSQGMASAVSPSSAGSSSRWTFSVRCCVSATDGPCVCAGFYTQPTYVVSTPSISLVRLSPQTIFICTLHNGPHIIAWSEPDGSAPMHVESRYLEHRRQHLKLFFVVDPRQAPPLGVLHHTATAPRYHVPLLCQSSNSVMAHKEGPSGLHGMPCTDIDGVMTGRGKRAAQADPQRRGSLRGKARHLTVYRRYVRICACAKEC